MTTPHLLALLACAALAAGCAPSASRAPLAASPAPSPAPAPERAAQAMVPSSRAFPGDASFPRDPSPRAAGRDARGRADLPFPGGSSLPVVPLPSGATGPDAEYVRRAERAGELAHRAELARDCGDIDEACRLYKQSFDEVDNPLRRLEMAQMLDRAHRDRLALKEYDALFDNPRFGGSYETDAAVLGRYAALCESQGRNEEAVDLYRRIVSSCQFPGDDPALVPSTDVKDLATLKATAEIMQGMQHGLHHDDKAARVHFAKAVALRPDLPLANFYLGLAAQRLHDPMVAEPALRKAHRLGNAAVREQVEMIRPDLVPKTPRPAHQADAARG